VKIDGPLDPFVEFGNESVGNDGLFEFRERHERNDLHDTAGERFLTSQ
jgi:hypothetical protein